MKHFITLFFTLLVSLSFSQEKDVIYPKGIDSSQVNKSVQVEQISRYKSLADTNMYLVTREFWKTNQRYTYVTFPVVKSLGNRKVPLRINEGIDNYKFEASMDFRIPLFKPNDNTCGLGKLARVTLDYHTNFRMTADSSSPLTPSTQDVGIGFDINIWNNKQHITKSTSKVSFSKNTIKNISLTGQVHHYSNGQPLGFFLFDASGNALRNDYAKGDFSTNYIKITGLYNLATAKNNVWSFALWGRFDGDFSGFEFTDEQQYRYGQNRVGWHIDFLSRPIIRKRTKRWKQDGKEYLIRRLYAFQARLSSETILGKLHEFSPNLTNSNKKYRTNINLDLRVQPVNSSAISGFIKFYAGRDYLNIRYDDIIWTTQLGISVPLNKYYVPRWESKSTLIGEINSY